MKRKIRFLSIFLIMGLAVITVFSIKPKAKWLDTNNNPVLTTEWDEYKVAPTNRIDIYQTYFIVNYDIPITDIGDKVLVFNKYSNLDSWVVFSSERTEVVIEYNDKPSVIRKIDYTINSNTMSGEEREEAYNRFFNSQFVFMNEDLEGVKKITLTLWLDSNGFSKSPPNYLDLDYYDDIVYLMPIDELPALNSFNLKSMKFYFKDNASYTTPDFYTFDFSHIPETYDYFIFNFGDNIVRAIYYGPEGDEFTDWVNIKTDVGFRFIDRNDLKWKIQFLSSFDNEDYYFIAYDYNYIMNLNDSLSRDILDAYNTGYNNGYDGGFIDGGNEAVLEGYQNGYDNGYYNGYDDGIISASDNTFYGIIAQVFAGLGSFLSIQLLPGITFGAILSVPLVFGIISFIIGKRGGKGD